MDRKTPGDVPPGGEAHRRKEQKETQCLHLSPSPGLQDYGMSQDLGHRDSSANNPRVHVRLLLVAAQVSTCTYYVFFDHSSTSVVIQLVFAASHRPSHHSLPEFPLLAEVSMGRTLSDPLPGNLIRFEINSGWDRLGMGPEKSDKILRW